MRTGTMWNDGAYRDADDSVTITRNGALVRAIDSALAAEGFGVDHPWSAYHQQQGALWAAIAAAMPVAKQ